MKHELKMLWSVQTKIAAETVRIYARAGNHNSSLSTDGSIATDYMHARHFHISFFFNLIMQLLCL